MKNNFEDQGDKLIVKIDTVKEGKRDSRAIKLASPTKTFTRIEKSKKDYHRHEKHKGRGFE